MLSSSSTEPTQLASASRPGEIAAARGSEQTASRGSARTVDPSLAAQQIALAATTPDLIAPADEVDPTTTTTSAPPTTTTTVKPVVITAVATTAKPKPAPKPPVETTPSGDVGDDVWVRLARCESGMRNDQGAPYYGYFQFSASTWRGIGGEGLPTDHTYEEQLEQAKKLQARSGWRSWPVCSRVALNG